MTIPKKQRKTSINSFIQEVTDLQKENQELRTTLRDIKNKYHKLYELMKDLTKVPQMIDFLEKTEKVIDEMQKIEEKEILKEMDEDEWSDI